MSHFLLRMGKKHQNYIGKTGLESSSHHLKNELSTGGLVTPRVQRKEPGFSNQTYWFQIPALPLTPEFP